MVHTRPHSFVLLITQPTPISTLFPYTTLFRSVWANHRVHGDVMGLSELPIPFIVSGNSHHSTGDRKSTRLNSSHVAISYGVSRLRKKLRQDRRDRAAGDESG